MSNTINIIGLSIITILTMGLYSINYSNLSQSSSYFLPTLTNSHAQEDGEGNLSQSSSYFLPTVRNSFAQEDGEGTDDEDIDENINEQVIINDATTTSIPTIINTTYAIEGNSSLLQSKLPLINRAVISEINDAIGIAQRNDNETMIVTAQITNEITGSTHTTSKFGAVKSLTSMELADAVDTLSNNRTDEGTSRLVADNQAQCTTGIDNTELSNTCQFTIRIHQ